MKRVGVVDIEGRDWLDFSSLSNYMRCPKHYFWQNIMSLQTKRNAALINGEAYHHAIANYHTLKMGGATHEEALPLAIESARPIMDTIEEPDDYRNTSNMVSTLTRYFDRWVDETYQTKEVEVGFAVDLINLIFVGKIDRVVDSPFGLMVVETKTTTIAGEGWLMRGKPNLQIDGYVSGLYITTGEMPYGGVLDIIPIQKETARKKADSVRVITTRSEEDVEFWIENVQGWWKRIQESKESGSWIMNTEACVPLRGFRCKYRTLCNIYPSTQGLNLEAIEVPDEFTHSPWYPFQELKIGEKKKEEVQ